MSSIAGLQAVILAGGLGTRLRPVVSDRPKALAPVGDRPFLTYLFDQLVEVGITQVTLCVGHLGEQISQTFGDAYQSLQLSYSWETELLGTGGGLRLALPQLTASTILVMNGDSFCQVNLEQFWQWHQQIQAQASLLLTHVPDTSRYGRVELTSDHQISRFQEKEQQAGPGWINAGIYLVGRSLLATIPPAQVISLESQIFPQWVGHGLYGYCNHGQFLDIGTPESYRLAAQLFS